MGIFLNAERKIKNVWWVAIFFMLLAALLFPLIIVADRFSFEITMLHQVVIIAIASVIGQWLRRKPISEITGKINIIWWKELLTGLSIGAALMAIPVLPLAGFGYIHWQVNEFSYSIIRSGFSTFLLVAIAEELLFRGFIFQRLIQGVGKWFAQVAIAALFLLTHLNNPSNGAVKILALTNIFIASIMFGIAFIKTKNLAMPLGLHFMANFIQGTILGFGVSGDKEPGLLTPIMPNLPVWISGGTFGIEASIGGLFCVILTTVFLYIWYPQKVI